MHDSEPLRLSAAARFLRPPEFTPPSRLRTPSPLVALFPTPLNPAVDKP
jgi:hypothetical protein